MRWAWEELNFRPHAYQACALTAELQARLREPMTRSLKTKQQVYVGSTQEFVLRREAPWCTEKVRAISTSRHPSEEDRVSH